MSSSPSIVRVVGTIVVMAMCWIPVSAAQQAAENGAEDSIWWNQPDIVEALELSDEVRTAMNSALGRYNEARRDHFQALQQNKKAFATAFGVAPSSELAEIVDKIGSEASAIARAEPTLMMEVFELLEPEQLTTLRETRQEIFDGRWLRRGQARQRASTKSVVERDQ